MRAHRTNDVVSELRGDNSTRVVLVVDAWGDGADREVAYACFDTAWASVMQSRKVCFEGGE